MKLCLLLLAAALACLIAGRLFGQAVSPVTVAMTSPISGQVVSNTITLTAEASSTVAPIQRVEFYMDGVLIGTKTVLPRKPEAVRLARQ